MDSKTNIEKNVDLVKMNVQTYIEVRTQQIEMLEKDIRESANNYTAYDMVAFLPNKLEALKQAMDELKMYKEQMKALEFIESYK